MDGVVAEAPLDLVLEAEAVVDEAPAEVVVQEHGEGGCDMTHMKGLLERLHPRRCDKYDEWIKVSQVIFHNFEDQVDGYEVFKEWSAKSPKFNEQGNKKIWKGFAKKKPDHPPTYRKVETMADRDDPQNEFQKLYLEKGEFEMMEAMNISICYKLDTSEYIAIHSIENMDFHIKNKAQFNEDFANKSFYVKMGTKNVEKNPFKIWRGSRWRREVQRIDFDPSNKMKNIFNLWRGYHITRDSCHEAPVEDCQAMLDHIKLIWCNSVDNLFEYALNWLAWVIQRPHLKICVMLALKSKQGAGKGIVLGAIQQIMDGDRPGGYFSQNSSVESLIGTYSYGMEGKCLLDFDEAFWGGDKKKEGEVKNLITETNIEVRQKYAHPYYIKNATAFILTTNNELFAGMTEDDRRHICLQMNSDYFECMTAAQKAEYFEKVSGRRYVGEYDPKVILALANFLYNRDITNFRPNCYPKTALAQHQIQQGWTTITRFWFCVLNTGSWGMMTQGWGDSKEDIDCPYNGYLYNCECGYKMKNGEGQTIVQYKKEWVYLRYLEMKMGAYGRKETREQFWKKTGEIFKKLIHRKKASKNNQRREVVIEFPHIDDGRKEFRKHQRYEGKLWDDEDAEDDADSGGDADGDYVDTDSD